MLSASYPASIHRLVNGEGAFRLWGDQKLCVMLPLPGANPMRSSAPEYGASFFANSEATVTAAAAAEDPSSRFVAAEEVARGIPSPPPSPSSSHHMGCPDSLNSSMKA